MCGFANHYLSQLDDLTKKSHNNLHSRSGEVLRVVSFPPLCSTAGLSGSLCLWVSVLRLYSPGEVFSFFTFSWKVFQKKHSSLTAWATGVSNPIRSTTLPRLGVSFTRGKCLRGWHSHPYTSILPVLGRFSYPNMKLQSKSLLWILRPFEDKLKSFSDHRPAL